MSVVPVIAAGTFYPGSLFSAGEQGVWYDPSDLNTMFEDSIGTTAVHVPGNGVADSPVGLMLDKRLGTSFGTNLPTNGPELITNGDFSNGTTGWSIYQQAGTGTLTASGGVATLTNSATATFGTAYQTIATTVGVWYRVTGTLVSSTSTGFQGLRKSDNMPASTNVVDIYSITGSLPANTSCDAYFCATATTTYICVQVNDASKSIQFKNISAKALTFGTQLITNGDFSSGTTGWSTYQTSGSATFTASSGTATLTNSSGTSYGTAYQSIRTTIGVWYKVTGTLVSATGSVFNSFRKSDDSPPNTNLVNIYSINGALPSNTACSGYFVATATTTYIAIQTNGANNSISFKDISVVAVPGNNASQATSTARPTLSARYNLLTYSEQFNNGAWAKDGTSVSADTTETTDPLGGNTADKIIISATTAVHRIYYSHGSVTNFTKSFYAKAGTASFISVDAQSGAYVVFDLSNGTISSSTATGSITSAGNGWYLCTANTGSSGSNSFMVISIGTTASNAIPGTTFAGGSQYLYLWGAQERINNDGVGLPAYQRIADANTYDSTGFPYYLKADGTDDSLATAAISFTSTNKMTVVSGLRKLSDSALAAYAELSATIASNNGTFLLSAPNSAAANYNFSSKGTTQVDNTVTTYTAPITSIITGIGDISAPNNQIRVNGSLAGTQTGSQGTGNYGNFALYLFRRNSASSPFNGRSYGLIIRGASSTSTEIANTETWLNTKTKAY